MITKIQGEAPFQVLTNNFSISPSQEGYTLQISADGVNYSNLFSVGANVTRLVTGVAANSYYRLLGNNSEVSINWMKTCVTEGGGGDMSNYYTKDETDAAISSSTSPIQEQLDDVERVTASALTELHQDILDLSGATPDLSNYYTKQETDTQIADAIADIPQPDMSNYYTKDQIGTKEEVVSRALNDLHEDILDLSGATPTNSPIIPAITTQAEYAAISGDVKTGDLIQVQGVDLDGDNNPEYGLFEANVQEEESEGVVRKLISWTKKDNGDSVFWSGEAYPWMVENDVNPIEIGVDTFIISADMTAENEAYNGIGFDADGKPVITHIVPHTDKQTGEITGITREDRAIVAGEGINRIMKLTQAEYDAITTPDASTLYIITNIVN